tara:strand:- start:1710 stop:1865 length:156 start_codon:yes stop_codon:yes gene_type:complete
MTERKEKELRAENDILRNNIKDLEKQLRWAYTRVDELKQVIRTLDARDTTT